MKIKLIISYLIFCFNIVIASNINSGLYRPDIESLKPLPKSNSGEIRVVNLNCAADYMDFRSGASDGSQDWENRRDALINLILEVNPDIAGLQELTVKQADYIAKKLSHLYSLKLLCQHPYEVSAGAIIDGARVNNWSNKRMGAPLIGILYRKKFFQSKHFNSFWLNEKTYKNTDYIPQLCDYVNGRTDQGFGNMGNFRAVFYARLFPIDNYSPFYVFVSHYPLDRQNKVQAECAKLERFMINKITGKHNWISMGDRNTINTKGEIQVYDNLIGKDSDIRDAAKHIGYATTWAGFSNNPFLNQIENNSFKRSDVLDLMIYGGPRLKAMLSFHAAGEFDPKTKQIVSKTEGIKNGKGRYFVSDHLMIGADFSLQ